MRQKNYQDKTFGMLYDRLIEILEDDEFPLKKEYDLVRQYSERLFARLEKPKRSDDWFDNFLG